MSARSVPEDSQNTRRLIQHITSNFATWATSALNDVPHGMQALNIQSHHWPPPDLHSQLALAQHYGLPTRLLDWSLSPHVACYFAARGAIDNTTDSFSVWGILTTPLHTGVQLRNEASNDAIDLAIVTAPRATNPNLHAQHGIFTIANPANDFPFVETDRRPLDDVLSGIENPNPNYSPLLVELVCPSAIAPELLWSLDKLNVNASTVFADYAGAAEAVREFPLQRAPS